MNSIFLFIIGYIVGGATLLPLTVYLIYQGFLQTVDKSANSNQKKEEEFVTVQKKEECVKKGWIRLSNQYQSKLPETVKKVMSGNRPITNQGVSKPKGVFYAVLIKDCIVCYESENQKHVAMILNTKEYQVSIYPKPKTENEFYGRAASLRFVPALLMKDEDIYDKPLDACTLSEEGITCNSTRVLYLNFPRKADKEDWYFGILNAQRIIVDPIKSTKYTMMDNTHFSPTSMHSLIQQVQSSQSQRDAAWLNAIMGRIFLAMYKTDRIKKWMVNKMRRKLDKTKRPNFLDEILIRSVDIGESVPFITDPKLISLTPQGEVIVEANVDYHGGLTIEMETHLNWSYSSLMKPIRMNLVLTAKLRKLKGRLMFKLKAPPSNRYWLAFFEMPSMDWKITPVVADKQIKWSLVTNAIESKIREIILDTYVLPNMDDTAFCSSYGDGGIFGEYVLRAKESMLARSTSTSAPSIATSRQSIYSDDNNINSNNNSNNNNNKKKNDNDTDVIIKGCPPLPEIREKPSISKSLNLSTCRTQSDSDITITTTITTTNTDNNDTKSAKSPVFESSPSSPTNGISPDLLGEQNQTRWSSTRLRKHKLHTKKDDESDSIYGDASSLDSSVARSIHNNDSIKKKGLRNRAVNFMPKKKSPGPDYTPLNQEKREQYAERLAQMRRRALDNKLADANDLNSFVKPEISANEPSPPPLPPRYKPLDTNPIIMKAVPPLPTASVHHAMNTLVK